MRKVKLKTTVLFNDDKYPSANFDNELNSLVAKIEQLCDQSKIWIFQSISTTESE